MLGRELNVCIQNLTGSRLQAMLRGIIQPIELNYNFALSQIWANMQKLLNWQKSIKFQKSQLGKEKHKIAKCLSQLGMEKMEKFNLI